MAMAMARGFVSSGQSNPERIFAVDPDVEARTRFTTAVPGAKSFEQGTELPGECRVLILAVKPHIVEVALKGFKPPPNSCIVSVVAGLSLKSLQMKTRQERVIRAMPNTPALIGEAATGLCSSDAATVEDKQLVSSLFESIGLVIEIDEPLLDSVTGLSGSGPAFVFRFIEAMIEAGVLNGLSRDQSRKLAVQTVFGAARMMQDSGDHPRVLADRVTSPMGTTAHGLRELDERGFAASVIAAVTSAATRARDLGK